MVIVETDPYVQKIESMTKSSKKKNAKVPSRTDHGYVIVAMVQKDRLASAPYSIPRYHSVKNSSAVETIVCFQPNLIGI